MEFVEGDCTYISYKDNNNEYKDAKNSAQEIINNSTFRHYAIELGLHTPAEIVLTSILLNENIIAKEITKQYNVNSDEMNFAITQLINYIKNPPYEPYASTPFIGISSEILSNANGMELMHEFVKLADNSRQFLPSKKIK